MQKGKKKHFIHLLQNCLWVLKSPFCPF